MSLALPEQFEKLGRFSDWILKNDRARNAKRLTSSMAEIKEFYSAMLSRLDEIMGYLNQFPLDDIPETVQNLCFLTFSLAEVAPAVENFGQPSVIDGFDSAKVYRTNRDRLEQMV